MELLLAEIFMQFAPQQYWDRQTIPTPIGAQMRPRIQPSNLTILDNLQPAGNNSSTHFSMAENSPSTDVLPQRTHDGDQSILNHHHTSDDLPTDMVTHPPTDKTHQPDFLPHTAPTVGTTTKFLRCLAGNICPHPDCSFPHRNNPGRLTRH